ncbi:hypothetical protein [Rhizobium phage RHEph12]|nr:hypothetical protein [Rhizobium phage RHEph12]
MKTKRKQRDLPIGGVQRYEIKSTTYFQATKEVRIARQSCHRYVIGGDIPSNALRIWSTFHMAEACIKACFQGWQIRLV